MPSVKIRYFASARELVNLREEVIELTPPSTVLDVLNLLIHRHEKLKDYLFDQKTGNPRPYLQFMVDDNLISKLNGFETSLKNDCSFSIIPPVGGG
jgi:MoaD family protein